MARPPASTIVRYAIPLKVLLQRFALATTVLLAFGLMLLAKADSRFMERVRVAVADMMSPIVDAASEPAQSVSDFMDSLTELAVLREENARLREENARLLEWERAARAMQAQNHALRALTNFVDVPAAAQIAARVIGDSSGVYVRSLLVAVGSVDGVAKGQAVMTGEGLVGRITEVGQRAARVLLITDLNSRIPVRVERTRGRAILLGDNTDLPLLQYLPSADSVAPGDRVVTSGDAGVFPPGLAVGEVVAVTDGTVRVQPFVDWDRLELVRVVDFALPGLIDDFHNDGEMADQPAGPEADVPEAPGPANMVTPVSDGTAVHQQ
ncbi:MAG: rod shape-determining protein MreC [Alphaproteobacteria bacterium]